MVGGLFLVLVIFTIAAVIWLTKKRRRVTERGAFIDQKEQVEENKSFKSPSSLHHQIDDDHYQEKRHRSSSLQITTEDNVAYVQAITTKENIVYGQTTANIQTEANIAYGGTIGNFTAEDNVVYYSVK